MGFFSLSFDYRWTGREDFIRTHLKERKLYQDYYILLSWILLHFANNIAICQLNAISYKL